MRKLNVTQAGAVSLLVALVGQAVAVIPSLKAEQAAIISTGTLVIAAVFVVVHAVHAVVDLANSREQVSLAQLEQGVKALARDEVGKVLGSVDLNATAKAALDGQDIAALVRAEAQKVFAPFAGVLGAGSAGSATGTLVTTPPPPTAEGGPAA